jgi:hypothetical protein
MAYVFSYYAIAIAFSMSLLNYIIVGMFDGSLDGVYLESWDVFLSMLVVFIGLSNVSFAVSEDWNMLSPTLTRLLVPDLRVPIAQSSVR